MDLCAQVGSFFLTKAMFGIAAQHEHDPYPLTRLFRISLTISRPSRPG
jgi:hypothetical protein